MDGLQAWTFGGSVITFLVPMITFCAVALGLLILYTKPELVPGRGGRGSRVFPATATWQPLMPVSGDTGEDDSGDTKPEESTESASAG